MPRNNPSRLLGFVSLLMLAACSPSEPAQPTAPPPLPIVTRPNAAVPQDRDPQAVLTALRQLDPCALVDPARAGVPDYPASIAPTPRGPHRCEVYRTFGDDEVEVILGAPYDAERRWNAAVVTIGGVKAYRSPHTDSCDIFVPVSFQLTIHIWARKGVHSTSNGDMCVPAHEFAEYAVTRLADPDNARPVLPMAERDACQVLTAALGDNPDGYQMAFNDALNGIDTCGGDADDPTRAAPALAARLAYGPDPSQETSYLRTIGGQPVRVYEDPSYCNLAWSVGKVHTPAGGATDQRVELQALDCGMGEAMVLAAMAHLRQPAPTTTAPRRPIAFGPDEPDLAVPGVCADYTSFDDPRYCQPAVNVPVPTGGAQILRSVAADSHVVCALSRDAVTRHFGEHLTPIVTTGRTCVFVESTRAVQIQIKVDLGDRLQDRSGARDVRIGGRAAVVYETVTKDDVIRYEIAVAVASGTEPGIVSFIAEFRRPRGAPYGDTTPIDTTAAHKLEPAATDTITTHFLAQ